MNVNYLTIAISSFVLATSANASLDLKRGDIAPNLVLKAVDGTVIDTKKMRDSTILLLFGETNHPQTEKACLLINKALDSALLHDQEINWLLILSKNSDPNKLPFDWSKSKRKPIVIHDTQRQAFGAFRTVVAPSTVIIDKQGKFIHGISGFTPDLGDKVHDAILVSAGIMTPERFDKNLNGGDIKVKDEKHLRAERLAHFAQQLSKRSMKSMAEAKYREALELAPDLQFARLGLAEILLSQNKLSEAQVLFQGVLVEKPDSQQALLGLASVSLKRAPPDIAHAQSLVERVIKHNKSSAQGHYMLGAIHEMKGDWASAAASYKAAANLLLKRLGPADEIPARKGSR